MLNNSAGENLPLVSVHVTSFNSANYIGDTLHSILTQDYANIELIVSDDCSTDNTAGILLNYQKKYPNIIKINVNETNLGITKNSNKALELCTGKYVTFLGGDDLFLPGKITKQVALMEKNASCVISYHNVEIFSSESNKILGYYNSWSRNGAHQGDVRNLLANGCFCSACSVMIRRDAIPEYGYNEKYIVASDYALFVESLLNGGTIMYFPDVMSRYRRHQSNVTNYTSMFFQQAYLDTLTMYCNTLVEYPCYTKYALKGIGSTLRAVRKFKGGSYFSILWNSLKLNPSVRASLGILMYIMSFGRKRL